MSNEIENEESFCKMSVEATNIFENVFEDLFCREVECSAKDYFIIPNNSIKDIFKKSTSWSIRFDTSWTRFVVKELNGGISGLILENYYKNLDDKVARAFYKRFSIIINGLLFSDCKCKTFFIKRSIDDISRRYDNVYKCINLENIFFDFHFDVDREEFVPNIFVNIEIEREEDVCKLVSEAG